jgi:hypothetical protein
MTLGQFDLVKDYCFVCGLRFRDVVPPGPANRENHHIVPRNAGGEAGPQVSLCDGHHTLVHKLAQAMHRGAKVETFLAGLEREQQAKLAWLAHVIVKAEAAVADDPNKTFGSSIKFSPDELAMLKVLQTTLGKTRTEVIKIALKILYQQTKEGRYSK